jgi:hypothetical protein
MRNSDRKKYEDSKNIANKIATAVINNSNISNGNNNS